MGPGSAGGRSKKQPHEPGKITTRRTTAVNDSSSCEDSEPENSPTENTSPHDYLKLRTYLSQVTYESYKPDEDLRKYMRDRKESTDKSSKKKKESTDKSSSRKESPDTTQYSVLLWVGAVVVAIVALFVFFNSDEPISSPQASQNIRQLEKDFPSQTNETWISLRAGARAFLSSEKTRPLVIFLTGEASDAQKCLGEKYLKALNKEVKFLDAGHVSGSEYGEFIELLKTALTDKGAVLIYGLENLDPRQAKALHVACDRESPLVEDAVVVITSKLSLDKITRKWREHIEEDKLVALFTRLKDRVVTVVSEKHLPCN